MLVTRRVCDHCREWNEAIRNCSMCGADCCSMCCRVLYDLNGLVICRRCHSRINGRPPGELVDMLKAFVDGS